MFVYGFKDNQEGIFEIEDTLEAKQSFVGGLVERVMISDHLDLVCNEEGLLLGLEPRVIIKDSLTVIHGDCFICRFTNLGDWKSIEVSDIEEIHNLIHYIDREQLMRALAMYCIIHEDGEDM